MCNNNNKSQNNDDHNNNNKNKLCYQTNQSPTHVLQYSQFKTGIGVVWSNNQSQLSLYLVVCKIPQHTMLWNFQQCSPYDLNQQCREHLLSLDCLPQWMTLLLHSEWQCCPHCSAHFSENEILCKGFLTVVDLVYNCFDWANSTTFYTNNVRLTYFFKNKKT